MEWVAAKKKKWHCVGSINRFHRRLIRCGRVFLRSCRCGGGRQHAEEQPYLTQWLQRLGRHLALHTLLSWLDMNPGISLITPSYMIHEIILHDRYCFYSVWFICDRIFFVEFWNIFVDEFPPLYIHTGNKLVCLFHEIFRFCILNVQKQWKRIHKNNIRHLRTWPYIAVCLNALFT